MRIRTLEITGFKSFPERTVLAFDRGISAIVGPNGCGKSNLIDALRWVMGEQNPRQLRGRSMEDMIFSGTERQAAVGMAEVVLSLDNSDGLAPPPYKGFAEIQIGRRLYRSGESEYRINKTPCRLRDVVDFFLDTGVGTRGYTIVEQGHIADLVSTRPQDRRTIFEQAAGIGKYRQRRRETEGKLRSTEQNLLRITDVIGELRRQIASLDRQARKANRYKQIKARLRDLELIEAREEHRAETAQLEAAERDIERQRAEGAELDARVGRAEAELEEARRTQLEREKQLQALSERLYSLRTVIQSLESRIDYESRERQGLAAQAAERDDEIARLEQQLVGRGAELTEKIAELSQVEKLLSADSEALAQREAELRDGSEKLSVVQGRREALQVRLADLGSERATLSSRLESLGERRHELELRLRQSEEALEASTLQVEGLEREEAELERGLHRALAERDDLGRRLSQELREQQQARASHQAGREELEGLRDRLKQAQTQLASLREMGEREAQRASALLERLPQEARGAIDGLLPEVLQVDDGLETAVEAVLGGRLEALLVGDAGAALRLTALLREDSLGRATIVPLGGGESGPEPGPAPLGRPLASFVRARGRRGALVERLLRDAYLVEDLTEAVERFGVGSPPATFVTRAGEVLDRSGAITGGLGAPPGALSRAREIRRLEADLPNLERSVRERAERIQEWAGRVASLETEIENTRSRRHTVELAVLNLEKDLERMRERGKEALQSAQGYREGRELTQSQLQRLEGDDRGIRTRLQEIESEHSRALANRDELSAEISSRGRELELLEQRLVQSRVELAQLGGRRDQIRQSREQLQAAVEDDRQWIGRWREEVRTARERAESLERSEQGARQELGERIADEERERSGQTELRSDFESGAERSREYEREVSAAAAERESLRNRLASRELELQEARMKCDQVSERIRERYDVDIAGYEPPAELLEGDPEARTAELGRLREQIRSLGDVNLGAIEDYEDVSERFRYLSEQKADLELSIERLRNAIARINRTSRGRFRETFEAIDREFRRLFPKMFEGGRAQLSLTEDEDVLEAGIEITAQPPGKKLQNVNLLSGGEKSLTAIALLMAVFAVKPSPFFLLDEVDAALDDANAARFNEQLREMARQSQFLLISHNKATIEIADTLYGVTMQEPGLSKLVTVDLVT